MLDLVFLRVHTPLEAVEGFIPDLDDADEHAVLLGVRNAHLIATVALVAQIHQFVEGEHLLVQFLICVRIHHA